MNRLAKLQKELKRYEGTEEFSKEEQLFLKKYYNLRKKEEQRIYSRLTLKQRIKIHSFVLGVYRLKNRMGRYSYEVLENKRIPTLQPVIFAITHIGKLDIEIVSEAIRDHYILLSGDFEHIQGNINAPFLGLNGVIYFNEKVKEDRHLVSKRMIAVLQAGGNLMYFPEGTWNLHPCLPLLPCYWGIIDVARQGKAIIIPVAIEQYEKHFKINIGKNFDVTDYPDTQQGKSNAIIDLRDALATLKWEIWETEVVKRKEVDWADWEIYKKRRFSEWIHFDEDYIKTLIYQPKGIIEREEAFDYLNKLSPCLENAFLFHK